jgi:dihydrofolate reductase
MKASVFIATSLDGYIARLDGGLDWLPTDCGEPHGYDEFMATIDAIVIGRKTFEIVLGFGGWPYGKKPVVVLSASMSELKAPDGAVCQLMSGPPPDILARLRDRDWKHLYIDGGVTIQRFLQAGLIQRLIITRIPVLLGSGIPLFGLLSQDIRLKHVATRAYPSGMVQSEYEIATPPRT